MSIVSGDKEFKDTLCNSKNLCYALPQKQHFSTTIDSSMFIYKSED